MKFDYLHSPRPILVERALELRIPERLHGALFALCAAVIVVGGSWGIESYRLGIALRTEALYQQRFEITELALRQTNVYYNSVRALVEIDKRIRAIAQSGDADARTLAEIANDLPAHAWLTGISHDEAGFALQGRAKNLAVVGQVVKGLMHGRTLRNPRLVDASAERDDLRRADIKYQIHVDSST